MPIKGSYGLFAALAMTTVLAAPAVHAQQIEFSVAAQPVTSGVLEIGRKAGLSVVLRESARISARGNAVSGVMTADQALRAFLAGSGYTHQFSNAGTVQIVPIGGQASQSGGDISLAPVVLTGSGAFVTTTSRGATKTDTPLLETPQSVSVVSKTELEQRNVQSLNQATEYTPGIRSGSAGLDTRYDSFSIRGFDATYKGVYLDGLRVPGSNMAIYKIDANSVDQLSILRGPSSALYGLGSPGGLVDVTSKRPTEVAFGEIGLQAGNYDQVQGTFDMGGPLNGDGTLLYRLTATAKDGETSNSIGGGENSLYNFAPTLTWKPDDQTSITFLGSYQNSTNPGGLPYYSWAGAPSTDFTYSLDDYNSLKQDQYRLGYALEHRISDNVVLRQNFRYSDIDTEGRFTGALGVTDNILSSYTGFVHDTLTGLMLDTNLQAELATGAVQHSLLFGVDLSRMELTTGVGYGSAPDFDLSTGQLLGRFTDPEFSTLSDQDQDQIGLYLQDQARIDKWIFTLSGRYDRVESSTLDRMTGDKQDTTDNEFTGRVGVSYQMDNGVAPYASYSTSFAPNLGLDANGDAFQPTTAEQYELGVKYQPKGFDGFFTASIFRLTEDNGLTAADDNPYQQVQRGRVRGDGLELEAVARLKNGFSLRGGYTYLDLETLTGTADTVGKVPTAVPKHAFTLWGNYSLPEGSAAEGLDLGLGIRYTGSTFGDAANTFENDAVTLVDASVVYDLGNAAPGLAGWIARLDIRNLSDEEFTTCEGGYCYLGARRTVMAGLNYKW